MLPIVLQPLHQPHLIDRSTGVAESCFTSVLHDVSEIYFEMGHEVAQIVLMLNPA